MPLSNSFKNKIAVAIAGLGSIVGASTATGMPHRGADVNTLASNCDIGPFPQTAKAGSYNSYCDIMEDAEKCLALIKRAFIFDGQNVTVERFDPQDEKAAYCLDALKRDLGN